MKAWIYRLSLRLAKVPSLVYAGCYLVLIPAYGLVYSNWSSEFFHGTVRYEGTLQADADSILRELQETLAMGFRFNHRDSTCLDGWRFPDSTFAVRSLKRTPDGVACVLSVDPSGPEGEVRHVEIQLEFSNDDVPGSAKLTRPPETIAWTAARFVRHSVQYYPSDLPIARDALVLFLLPYEHERIGNRFKLRLPEALGDRMGRFCNAADGLPAGIGGTYWRMLYLSAVTITTLGYGDIVPLTLLTRFLTTSEAVLGIIVIGLFLNSLSHEGSGKNG